MYLSPPMKPGVSRGRIGRGVRTMGSASYPSCAASATAHSTDCDDTHSLSKNSRPKGINGLSPCHLCRTSRLCPSALPFWFSPFRGRPRGRGAVPFRFFTLLPAHASESRREASPSISPEAAGLWRQRRSCDVSCCRGTHDRTRHADTRCNDA